MQNGNIDMVIVGADRITANGDVVNKIGTYEKAVIARENNIGFYVAAPQMTFDLTTETGRDVKIEERDVKEITHITGISEEGKVTRVRITEENADVKNPSFDVTPFKYVKGFITEKGIIYPPFKENIRKIFQKTC
jgi:methylthioribose-1-phosphate isomerase